MISNILSRRVNIIKNRIFTTFAAILLLPVLLNIIINLPFKRMLIRPLWQVSFEQWIYPGLIIIIAIILMIPNIYRDLFEQRIHNKVLPSLSLTPISPAVFLYNFVLSVLIESIIYTLITMIILSTLILPGFSIIDYLIMLPFIVLFIALAANILITISLLINKTTIYYVILLPFFLFIVFAAGTVIEFEYFPKIIGDILRYLPTGQIMQSMRSLMFSGVVNWIILLSILVTLILWTYINGILFKKRINA